MLERKLEVARLIEGRVHREKAMVECTSLDMITVSCKMENKFTGSK